MKLDLDRSAEIGARVVVLSRLDEAADAVRYFGGEGAFEALERSLARTRAALRIWREYLPKKSRKVAKEAAVPPRLAPGTAR